MSKPALPERTPGFLERYYICRDTTGIMNRGFNISVRLNTPVSDSILSNALKRVIASCPYLTVNAFREPNDEHQPNHDRIDAKLPATQIMREPEELMVADAKADGRNYRLRPVKEIRYSQVVFNETVEDFDEIVLENFASNRIPVDCERPMWRIYRLNVLSSGDEYLIFACNHVVFDGRSAVNFFEDLVSAIDDITQKPCPAVAEVLFDSSIDSITYLPDSSENLTKLYNPPTWFAISTILSHLLVPKFVSRFLKSYLLPWHPNLYKNPIFKAAALDGNNISKFRLVRFSSGEAQDILSNCKSQQSTLTPVLAATLYRAIDKAFKPYLGAFSQSCELVICGRRFYPENIKQTRYGLFVSAYTPYLTPSLSIADTARRLSNGLLKAMSNKHTFHKAGLLKLFNIWDYLRSFTTGKEERHTFEISNLGRMCMNTGGWRVTDAIFSQGVTSAHITLSVVSTPEGGMNITIAFHEKLLQFSDGTNLAIDQCIKTFKESLLSD
ncbi:hypothetical protein OXX69_007031 [Metschnikowia pulcherrima]